jgi:hypothetical protein
MTPTRPEPGPATDPTAPALGAVLSGLARRPWLWPDAVAQALRLARRGWWHRWPPLPLPDSAWWRFRMETAYGGRGDQTPDPDDVATFVDWSRNMGRWRKR